MAGDSLTIVNTAMVSTGNVCVMPKFMDVRTRKNTKRSFARNAARTFRGTARTRLTRKTASVFPALDSADFSGVGYTMAAYRRLVGTPKGVVRKLRVRNPCLGGGVTKTR